MGLTMSWPSVLKGLLAVCIFTHLFVSSVVPTISLRSLKKGCSKDGCTELAFSVTLGNHRTFRYDHQCCNTEKCNKQSKPVSLPSHEYNGVECLACYSYDAARCDTVSLKCTGVETKCLEVAGTEVTDAVSHSMIQGMGCATETACNLKNMTVMENVQINTHCFSGSPPLRPISSVLTSLFLMEALLCPLGTVTSMILLHI
ncbi:protein RoBo-1-like [Cricetulus griseus]|uniref:Protein RoBo-1-like n=1 Tax=Cricetulus griseus TaxID=10029 RepID=A0A9J7H3D6_CRIGR|nr:protein RoBo-1-like [Cricetulus griseus]XP_035317639.1 protein RoBo-1-like [Cricetulus griseus]